MFAFKTNKKWAFLIITMCILNRPINAQSGPGTQNQAQAQSQSQSQSQTQAQGQIQSQSQSQTQVQTQVQAGTNSASPTAQLTSAVDSINSALAILGVGAGNPPASPTGTGTPAAPGSNSGGTPTASPVNLATLISIVPVNWQQMLPDLLAFFQNFPPTQNLAVAAIIQQLVTIASQVPNGVNIVTSLLVLVNSILNIVTAVPYVGGLLLPLIAILNAQQSTVGSVVGVLNPQQVLAIVNAVNTPNTNGATIATNQLQQILTPINAVTGGAANNGFLQLGIIPGVDNLVALPPDLSIVENLPNQIVGSTFLLVPQILQPVQTTANAVPVVNNAIPSIDSLLNGVFTTAVTGVSALPPLPSVPLQPVVNAVPIPLGLFNNLFGTATGLGAQFGQTAGGLVNSAGGLTNIVTNTATGLAGTAGGTPAGGAQAGGQVAVQATAGAGTGR